MLSQGVHHAGVELLRPAVGIEPHQSLSLRLEATEVVGPGGTPVLFSTHSRKRLFNLSDRMEQSAGRLPSDLSPWGDGDELEHVLASTPPPPQIVLAASGPDPVMKRRLKPLRQAVESAGYRCGVPSSDVPFTRVLICAKALGN